MKSYRPKTFVIILSSIAAAFAVGGAILMFLAMTNDFDASIMHFEYGSAFAGAAFAVCVMSVALAAGGFFMSTNRIAYDDGAKFSSITVFISTLAGLTCLLYAFVAIRGGLPETKIAVYIAEIVFSILSAAFFLMKAAGVFEKKPAFSLTGLFPALMCAFALLRVYFDSNEPLNSPLKIYQIVMLVTFMLYFTAESGISIGRPKMSRKFTFASLTAISIGGMISISRVASRVADVDTFNFNMVIESFRLILWLYVVVTFAIKLLNAREKTVGYALLNNEDGEKKETEAESGKEDDELLDGIAAKLKDIDGKATEYTAEEKTAEEVPEEISEERSDEIAEEKSESETEDEPEEESETEEPEIEGPEAEEPEIEELEAEEPEAEEPEAEVPEEAEDVSEKKYEESARILLQDDEPSYAEESAGDDSNPFTYNGGTADDEAEKKEN